MHGSRLDPAGRFSTFLHEATTSSAPKARRNPVRDDPALILRAVMVWIILVAAGLLEIVWALALKASDGFTRPIPSVIAVVGMIASVVLLALAMRSLPVGTAYVVWTGIGAVGAFIAGVVYFGEDLGAMRVIAAGLIVSGLVLMKVASPS
jgi:quaternary ammonium compound-resistance protein SugE